MDMLSTILDANNVVRDKCSQDSDDAFRSSVADITIIQGLINAATEKFSPGSRRVLSQLLTINFVGAITSILLSNDVALETSWLPYDQHVIGVVPHCSFHSAAAVAMEPELFLHLFGVLLLGKESLYLHQTVWFCICMLGTFTSIG